MRNSIRLYLELKKIILNKHYKLLKKHGTCTAPSVRGRLRPSPPSSPSLPTPPILDKSPTTPSIQTPIPRAYLHIFEDSFEVVFCHPLRLDVPILCHHTSASLQRRWERKRSKRGSKFTQTKGKGKRKEIFYSPNSSACSLWQATHIQRGRFRLSGLRHFDKSKKVTDKNLQTENILIKKVSVCSFETSKNVRSFMVKIE